MTKRTLFFIIFILSALCLNAQEKKAMDHYVYNSWKEVSGLKISNNGNHIVYLVNPQKGDNKLVIYSENRGYDSIPRVNKIKITSDSKFLAGHIVPQFDTIRQLKIEKKKKDDFPKDSLLVVNLNDLSKEKFENVRSFAVADKGENSWIVYHKEYTKKAKDENSEETEEEIQEEEGSEEEGNTTEKKIEKSYKKIKSKLKLADLIIFNPLTKKSFSFENVYNYHLSENGNLVSFTQIPKDSVIRSVVYVFDMKAEKSSIIFESKGSVEKLATGRNGLQSAFLFASDSGTVSGLQLHHWEYGKDQAELLVDSADNQLKDEWGISKFGKLWFSGSGERLFFGTAPIPEEISEDSIPEDEKAKLDVWSWNDDYLQPQQKKQQVREKQKNFLAYYDLQRKKLIQLASENIESVATMHEGDGDYMLGFEFKKYGQLISWEGLSYRDIFLIDALSGESKMILTKKCDQVILSPFGKYVAFYERMDSAWFAYDIESEKIRNLTTDIPVNFYDEWNDVPQLPSSYGILNFTENDEYILLYDFYDIWKIDPSGNEAPINFTNTYGRKNRNRLRYIKTDPDEYFLDLKKDILFTFVNENTMEEGVLKWAGSNTDPIKLLASEHNYFGFRKAKDSDEIIFRRGNFREYNDVYHTTTRFSFIEKISDANPQASDYLWGDAQLVEWESFHNDNLKGILYTPENLDESKKYPMLVYFYERSSHRLHSHRIPSPSRSIISIPWCTSNEYVVFVPDIIYRNGYPGQSAYDAVVSGTQAMTERYEFIDSDRIGLQGQSWGGYQIAWLVTQTNMFAAAMAGAPVSNMTSAYGGIRWGTGMSRMFQYEKTQSRIGGTLWDKKHLYIENSPLFYVPRIETPVLIMHNDKDGAVPWYQGIEYFVALRRLNKPAWMLTYNNEDHNLTKWPNRIDLSIRMMQFFDHYLKDDSMPPWMEKGVPAIDKDERNGYELLQ